MANNTKESSDLRVLRYLYEKAKGHPKWECSPYVKDIGEALGLSRGYVTTLTSRLRKLGLIEYEQQWIDERNRKVDVSYWVDENGKKEFLFDPEELIRSGPNCYRILDPKTVADFLEKPDRERLKGSALMSTSKSTVMSTFRETTIVGKAEPTQLALVLFENKNQFTLFDQAVSQ